MTLLSAHRFGAGDDRAVENSRLGLERAFEYDAEYVEFDVQRCADGTLVLFHDHHVKVDGEPVRVDELTYDELAATGRSCVPFEEALELMRGRKRAHIDLKFLSAIEAYAGDPAATYEVEATAIAARILGAGEFIVTTLEDCSVKAIRTWSRDHCPELLVGLSLGRDLTGQRLLRIVRTRLSELFPGRRVAACGANLIVANKTLARVTVGRFARRRGLPMLVWTVDDPGELAYWLANRDAWMVTTNFPKRAAEIRNTRAVQQTPA